MNKKLLHLFICLIVFRINAQTPTFTKTLDSIQRLRVLSADTTLDFEKRLVFANRATELSHKTSVDSTILLSNKKVSNLYLDFDDYDNAIKINHIILKLAYKLKDSASTGLANYNLGYVYHNIETQNDSAFFYYFHAIEVYHKIKNTQLEAEVLGNIANLQETYKDYSNSEYNIIKALELLKYLPENNRNLGTKWQLYDLLGIISERHENHDKAIEYYTKSLGIANKMNEPLVYFLNTKNKIAFSYLNKGELKKAMSIFQKILSNKRLINIDLPNYANVLENIARTRFLLNDNDYKSIDKQFKEAYKISDSIQDFYAMTAALNDMSEFYKSIGKKDSAIVLSNNAFQLGKKINYNEQVLKSLLFLSKMESGETSKAHLYEYIKLKDSIFDNERSMRNKFARIQFETDEIENKNKKITKDKQLLLITIFALLATLLLLYLNFAQRAKNKSLLFEKEQQKANDEIYSLMLKQQTKLKEERIKERHRISEELHDGILSKLFGIRMSFGLLTTKMNSDQDLALKQNENIKHLQDTEIEIRKIAHELNNDILNSQADFSTIIKQYIHDLSELHLFEYNFKTKGQIYWEDINDKLKINLYRIIQEALQNIIKHAQANTINVLFELQNEILCLTIKDDGIGFNSKLKNNGIGLKNMKSRINNLNGNLKINSNTSKYTTVTVTIPIINV